MKKNRKEETKEAQRQEKRNGEMKAKFPSNWASLVAQRVKNLPAMQETRVRSLDQEDPFEKGMTTHSSIRAWRIPWTEEL